MKKFLAVSFLSTVFILSGCFAGEDIENSVVNVQVPSADQSVSLSLQENTKLTSGMTVTGSAPGTWFSEGQIPFELQASDGTVIAQASALADSEWMTESTVPFTATLDFQTTATSGKIIIRKANPSGLPENDGSYSLAVSY